MPCSSQGFALQINKEVSKEAAKKLGVTIRSQQNGEEGVAVWLEFNPQGELKNFTRVELEITAAGKSLVHAPLLTSRPTEDNVSVHFSADPAYLATSELTILVQDEKDTRLVYQFKLKDFIEGR